MRSQRFHAVIAAGPGDSAIITMPFDPDQAWGAKANHPVGGTIGGCRIRGRLLPQGLPPLDRCDHPPPGSSCGPHH
jgi:hypothetical protein